MGIEGARTCLKLGDMERISTPPGFVSQTSFVLRNVPRDTESSRPVSGLEQITGFGTDDVFNMIIKKRPWIVHDHTTPSSETLKPKARARRLPKVSETEVLKEAPVFHPNEEEFSDTLSYIASLRERAEPYGICCVVPPPSWKPPCLLEEKKTWETSTFSSQLQLFDGINTVTPKIKKEADEASDDAASEEVKFCRTGRGPIYTLENFKVYADASKERHFSIRNEVLGSKNSSTSLKPKEPTLAEIEKEYRQLVESPVVEIGLLCGTDVDTRTFGSGFPLAGPSESCKYKTSGWNLNNTAKLPGSLLSFEDSESLCVPRLSVGMCLSSQLWKPEKERLYSLCYLHLGGAPRVWYSVAGHHGSKFKATVSSLVPELSEEQPKSSYHPMMTMSPYALNADGIPVTRCVQNPGQYVVIFPGSYSSAFDCGFNCLEKVNFAPVDWLPHGDIAVQLNQEESKKSSISYDNLLFRAAREAVKCLKEYHFSRKETAKTADVMRWKNSCGKDGVFSNIVKSRIKQEKSRREFLIGSLESKRMDESYDVVSKRECCVCFVDLHLSAVQCSCSGDRYSCLSHTRKLCACPYDRKSFLYRYTIDELNILAEALLENRLSATYRWEKIVHNNNCVSPAITSSQCVEKGKTTDEVITSDITSSLPEEDKSDETDEVTPCNNAREDVVAGIKDHQTRVKARSLADIMKEDDEKELLKSCSKKSTRPCDSSAAVNKAKKQKQ